MSAHGRVFVALAVFTAVRAAPGDPTQGLRIRGELSGEVAYPGLAGGPTLHWSARIAPPVDSPGLAGVALSIVGPGTDAELELHPVASGQSRWTLKRCKLDLATWMPVVMRNYADATAGTTATGVASAAGSGSIRGRGVTGTVRFQFTDLALENPAEKWSVRGVTAEGTVKIGDRIESAGPTRIAFRGASFNGIGLGPGTIELSVDARRILHVSHLDCAMFGGGVTAGPFDFALARPALETQLHFAGVDLGGFTRFLPSVIASAKGGVSGVVRLRWSASDDAFAATGSLRPSPGARPSIALAESPGLLTSAFPAGLRGRRMDLVALMRMPGFLRSLLRPFARLLRPKNPIFQTLHGVEMGSIPVALNRLDLDFRHPPDGMRRSGSIVFVGTPVSPTGTVISLRLQVPIFGPLADLIRLSMQQNVSVSARMR